MAVALVHCRIGREAVEITIASGIPNPDTFAARQNDTERLVVLGAKARFRRDEIRDRTHLFVTPVAANWHQLGCITAPYWFTASTSFAKPAVALTRSRGGRPRISVWKEDVTMAPLRDANLHALRR